MGLVKGLLMVPGRTKKELTQVGGGDIPIIMKNKQKAERPQQATAEALNMLDTTEHIIGHPAGKVKPFSEYFLHERVQGCTEQQGKSLIGKSKANIQ